jgi:8-oxo-dGTP pyrophosphatase MutT (NUDIX family)
VDPVSGGRVVQAAGGVVWRRRDGRVETLLVHRPRYDDWSLPKGKLDPGESHEEAARREVHEETGLRAELGVELPPCHYVDGRGRDKVVRYWAMTVDGDDDEFVPNDEVDQRRWLAMPKARSRLSYGRDRKVLDDFVAAVVEV